MDDERVWFEASLSFEAVSYEEAEEVVDAVALAICQGHGEGEDHVCARQFVIGGPKLVGLEE